MSELRIAGISKRFGHVQAVDAIDIVAPAGSRTAIVGPSGSGKTTLLRLIAGFERPDAGSMTLDGQILANDGHAVPAHQRGIGFVSQHGALFPHLDVAANIGFGLARNLPDYDRRVVSLMDMVQLEQSMRTRMPHELSGGQQQRVALARALARRPKLMLLDEPFSALDTGLRESMRKMVADVLQSAGITTVLVTHDQAEALSFSDQVAVLQDGRLVQAGAPRDLYFSPRDQDTAKFFGDAIILPATFQSNEARCAIGRVRLRSPAPSGDGVILLRPEQLRLISVLEGDTASTEGLLAEIVDVTFGGATCMVAVRACHHQTDAAAQIPDPLWIRTSSLDLPKIGALVRLVAVGEAHAFSI
jgi:iron(III) transport system ATP-binding protein